MGRPRGKDREKISLRLQIQHVERLKALAENDGTTITEQIDRAFSMYLRTRRIRRKGGNENEKND